MGKSTVSGTFEDYEYLLLVLLHRHKKKITQEKHLKEGHICLGSWFNKDVVQHGEKSWGQEGAAMGGIASTVRKQSVDKK